LQIIVAHIEGFQGNAQRFGGLFGVAVTASEEGAYMERFDLESLFLDCAHGQHAVQTAGE
jgi:hypothetical protein